MIATRQEPPPEVAPLFASEDEKGLVGSMIFDPDCIGDATKLVGPTDFGDFALRAVYESITKRHREASGDGQALAAMVLQDIKEHPAVDDGRQLLCMIAESIATAAHVKTFALAVRDASLKRRINDIATTAARASSNGQAGADVLADLQADIEALANSSDRNAGIKKLTLAELVEKHPHLSPPVIDGFVREGETCNVIAASKVGKSWFAYLLALSIVMGHRFLGRFDTAQGKVLLIDNELHPETLANRIPAVAEAMGIPLDMVDRDLEVVSLRGDLRSLEDLGSLIDAIEPGQYKAIIFDAFYRFATEGVSENDNAAMTLVYNLLDQYAAKTKAALFVIHHSSKGDQSGKAVTDVGSGAGAQSRATDCHMVIRPHEEDGCAVLDAAVRSFAPVQPLTLRWSFPVWIADEHLDPAKLAGRLGKGQQARSEEDQANKELIVEKLASVEKPLSIRGIRESTGFGKDKAERLVFALMADGRVESSEGLSRNNKCTVFSLPESGGLGGTPGGQTTNVPPASGGPVGGGVGGPKGGQPPTHHVPGTPFPEFMDLEESA